MYCPSCGNEITVELNFCKRCGANLSLPSTNFTVPPVVPVSLTGASVFLGLTIICGLGVIFIGANELLARGLHPAALAWIVLFSMATLLGCTALFIRFWSKLIAVQRESVFSQQAPRQTALERPSQQQLPPRFEPAPSVTENTTRTFSPIYREPTNR